MAAAALDFVLPLASGTLKDAVVGGKAARLSELAAAGVRVPDGFAVAVEAYERFVQANRLADVIHMVLERRPLETLRWEEVWDAALRIRTAFLAAPIPPEISGAVRRALGALGSEAVLAVRSSAPGEDSAGRSFAGLHESVVGVQGAEAVLDALRIVWASLWSDAALLYRRELGLDPRQSRMAAVIQPLHEEDRSGVAFGRDPRDIGREVQIVEAVPGRCADLVDGQVDPDRWELARSSGQVLAWRRGDRGGAGGGVPLLGSPDLTELHRLLGRVEGHLGWPPDMEWTGRADRLVVLQARPITTGEAPPASDKRAWYLTLRPGPERLRALRHRVVEVLIPALQNDGERLAAEPIEELDDDRLAEALEARRGAVEHWRRVYESDFIPFAHGVRHLGQYYADAVRPTDPYEFVGLLRGQDMIAGRRNRALGELADRLRRHPALAERLQRALQEAPACCWETLAAEFQADEAGTRFVESFETFRAEFLDLSYQGQRLTAHPELVLSALAELARGRADRPARPAERVPDPGPVLEERLLTAVGETRRAEALEVLETARISWRLRDDDNLLLGRVESQLVRAVEAAALRLRRAGRLSGEPAGMAAAAELARALVDPTHVPALSPPAPAPPPGPARPNAVPRQLLGQPAAPGLATGRARVLRGVEGLRRVRAGEVLVCDAIQPTMTHLVPLAAAVVERRGGMLIHGAIIARELGIPCVNGVASAAEILQDGDLVTVDGHLGIVTVGEPEFDLERRPS